FGNFVNAPNCKAEAPSDKRCNNQLHPKGSKQNNYIFQYITIIALAPQPLLLADGGLIGWLPREGR
ncbi:MAG: hypothetical protein ACKOEW_07485, partial [Methylocystis sp.]